MAALTMPNFEEAASVATEFITSLDNLPNEVQHLLQEIKIKEQKCQELQQDTARDQARYIKSAMKNGASATSISSALSGNKSATSSPTPSTSESFKAHLPARIAEAYAEIEALNNDKIALAHRLVNLLSFTRARLDADLTKVRTLQGESIEDIRVPTFSASNQLALSMPYATKRTESSSAINPVVQINESLRNATGDSILSLSPAPGSGYNKKRRLTTNTSIKLPSPAPASVAQHTTSSSRSRLSRQSHAARSLQHDDDDLDADAEGEEDIEGEDAEEDLTLYCFCHKQSYGDMIGCDNPDCPYQWFHISCVGVKTPLPDKWYCPECIKNKSVAVERRKGRKK